MDLPVVTLKTSAVQSRVITSLHLLFHPPASRSHSCTVKRFALTQPPQSPSRSSASSPSMLSSLPTRSLPETFSSPPSPWKTPLQLIMIPNLHFFTQNRMQESLALFYTTIHSPWFHSTSIILFLNKTDILADKIQTSDLQKYFPSFAGEPRMKVQRCLSVCETKPPAMEPFFFA